MGLCLQISRCLEGAEREAGMRRTVGIALSVILIAAALGIWFQSGFLKVNPAATKALELSSAPLSPLELMRAADRNLPAENHEPF
jgi:hypothetical protein